MKLLNVSKWAKVRTRGLRRFILVNGILGFGLFMARYVVGTSRRLEPGRCRGRVGRLSDREEAGEEAGSTVHFVYC